MNSLNLFGRIRAVPRTVKSICFASFFINMSTLMIFSFFGIYLHNNLGVNLTKIGILDGTVEACSFIMKLFSGYLSDLLCNRKILLLFGASLLFLAKPLEALGRSFAPLFCAKVLERMGNGIQSTPRDALVGDWAPAKHQASCFGVRQGMAAIGALLGTVLAAVLYRILDNFQLVFWCACIPAATAVIIVIFGIENKRVIKQSETEKSSCGIKIKDISKFSKRYWLLLAIAAIYNCAKVSESLIILNVTTAFDLNIFMCPLILAICYISNSLTAIVSGQISDKMKSATPIFMFGLGMFVIADLLFIFGGGNPSVTLLALLCMGSYTGVSQSIFAAKISEIAPSGLKGTGLGLYNLTCALSLLLGGSIIGKTADLFGFNYAFGLSSILAGIALSILFTINKKMN